MAVSEDTLFRSIRSYTDTEGRKVTLQKYSRSEKEIKEIDQAAADTIEKYQLENGLKTAKFVNYHTDHSTGILNLFTEIKKTNGLYRAAFKVHVVRDEHHHFHRFAFRCDKIQDQASRAVQVAWLLTKDHRGYDVDDLYNALEYVKTDQFWERIYGSIKRSLENLGLPRKPMHYLAMENSLQIKTQQKYIQVRLLSNEMVQVKVNMPKSICEDKEHVINFNSISRSCSNYGDLLRILALYAAYICHLTTQRRLKNGGTSYVIGLYFQLASFWREMIEENTTSWRWDSATSELELNLTHFLKRVDAELLALGDNKLFNSETDDITPLHTNIDASIRSNSLDNEELREKYYREVSEKLPKYFTIRMLEEYLPELFPNLDFSSRALKSLPKIVKVGQSLKNVSIVYTVRQSTENRIDASDETDKHMIGMTTLFEVIQSFAGERQFKLDELHVHLQNYNEIDPFDINKLSPRKVRNLMKQMPSIVDIKPEKPRDKMRFQIAHQTSENAKL